MDRRKFLMIIGGATIALSLGLRPEQTDSLRLGFVGYEKVGMIVINRKALEVFDFEVVSCPKIPYAAVKAYADSEYR